MQIKRHFLMPCIVAAALLVTAPCYAGTAGLQPQNAVVVSDNSAASPSGGSDRPPPVRPMTTLEKMGVGCLASGGGALTATYVVGPSELIMLLMGGLIVPSSSSVLMVSLIGTMTSVACGAGVYAEPFVEWALDAAGISG